MPLFQNTDRLIASLQLLTHQREHINKFYNSILKLQVTSEGIDKYKETLRASVNERRGASFNRGEHAVQSFDNIIEDLVNEVNNTIEQNTEESHRLLFESIVRLPNIDQKIAAMYIKFLCLYLNIWPQMIPFLYVPIDRVVLKILGDKLQVYTGKWAQAPTVKNPQGNLYIRGNQPSSQYNSYIEFQQEISNIVEGTNIPRIMVDELWFIGFLFCKPYPLCSKCWVNELCQGSPFN